MQRIKVGLILKRNPIVLPEPKPFQKAVKTLQMQKYQQSAAPYRADFFESEKNMFKKKDQIPESEQEIDPIMYAERKTESTKDLNDFNLLKKLDRRMDRNLYLLKKDDNQWIFPESFVHAEESLKDACHREIQTTCGDKLSYWIVGEAPVCFQEQKDSKIFYMKSQIFSGQVKPETDFIWVTKDEMPNFMPKTYFENVKDALANL